LDDDLKEKKEESKIKWVAVEEKWKWMKIAQ
jgi:hypothetical protein